MARSPSEIPLHYLFAHNAWATEQLLVLYETLTEEQRAATAPGAVGNALQALHHIVQAEQGYLSRLAPTLAQSHWQPYLAKDFGAVRERAAELERLWSVYAATDPDAGATCRAEWPDVTHEFPAGMEIVQAISHSYAHREQVCTILTTLGLQPPELQGLAWGNATRLLRRLPPSR
jgi:uncharacterized damage-inducible protein DinB